MSLIRDFHEPPADAQRRIAGELLNLRARLISSGLASSYEFDVVLPADTFDPDTLTFVGLPVIISDDNEIGILVKKAKS